MLGGHLPLLLRLFPSIADSLTEASRVCSRTPKVRSSGHSTAGRFFVDHHLLPDGLPFLCKLACKFANENELVDPWEAADFTPKSDLC